MRARHVGERPRVRAFDNALRVAADCSRDACGLLDLTPDDHHSLVPERSSGGRFSQLA